MESLNYSLVDPPSVKPLQNDSTQINTSYTRVCILSNVGNPAATNFTWIRMDNNTIIGTEQTLTIDKVSLLDEGEYRCISSNTMQPTWEQSEAGYGLSNFHLKVICKFKLCQLFTYRMHFAACVSLYLNLSFVAVKSMCIT